MNYTVHNCSFVVHIWPGHLDIAHSVNTFHQTLVMSFRTNNTRIIICVYFGIIVRLSYHELWPEQNFNKSKDWAQAVKCHVPQPNVSS